MRDQATAASAVRIRPATAADAEHIARVHVESWRTAYRGLVPQAILDGLSIERRSEFWSRRLLEPGETRTWLGEHGDEVVGFVATGRPSDPELPPDAAEVESIYVLADSRGLGLGRLLLTTATRDLVERGFASAILWVFTANDRARRFYEAAGWAPDGTSQMLDFDGTSIEEIRYGIDLVSGP